MTEFRDEREVRRAIDAEWQRCAIAACLEGAREVVRNALNPKTPVGSLSDVEWGWISTAIVFEWVSVKARQAVKEGMPSENTIRVMEEGNREPAPWESGAIETVLPALGNIKDLDWSAPIGNWSKEAMIKFSWHCFRLINGAIAARDEGSLDHLLKRFTTDVRELSASSGGPLATPGELNDF
jgi:hypothetical protein